MPDLPRNARIKLRKIGIDHSRRREGGKSIEYHIDCLPPETKTHLLAEKARQLRSKPALSVVKESESESLSVDEMWQRFDEVGTEQQEIAKSKYRACLLVRELTIKGMKRAAAIRKAADAFGHKASVINYWLYNKPGLTRMDVDMWLPALVSGNALRQTRKKTPISPEAWAFFVKDFLRPEKPTWTDCWNHTTAAAKEHGWQLPGTLQTMKNQFHDRIPSELVVYSREGQFKAQQTLVPALQRTREGMHAMERVSGDGHTLRIRCHLEDGTVCRLTVWAFQDVYSSRVVGWAIDVSENTEMLSIALYHMIKRYGIPTAFDLDRGSVALGDEVTGRMSRPKRNGSGRLVHKKFDNAEIEGVITALGSKVNWTKVEDDNVGRKGNARGKPVERLFKEAGGIGEFEKHPAFAGAYTGKDTTSKPANYGETTVPAELVVEIFSEWVEEWNAREGRRSEMARGIYSYQQVFERSYQMVQVRKPTDTQLRLCLLRTAKGVTVHQGGYVDLNAARHSKDMANRYHSALLREYIGQKVVLRYNPFNLTNEVYAYEESGRYIGEIPLYGKAAYDDISAARRHALHQTEELERVKYLSDQMNTLKDEDFKQLSRTTREEESAGQGMPSVVEMTTEFPTSLEGLAALDAGQKKRAVGHDAQHSTDIVDIDTADIAALTEHMKRYGQS